MIEAMSRLNLKCAFTKFNAKIDKEKVLVL